jgi:hypothetical protein
MEHVLWSFVIRSTTWCVNGIALIGYVHKIAKPNCLKRFGSNILYTVATNTWLTVLRITNDQRTCSICHYPVLSSFMIHHLVCNKSNTRGGTCGAGTATQTVKFEVQVKVWSRPICFCGILYFKLNGIDAINDITIEVITSKVLTIATMTWLTVLEYMCHKWPQICSTCCKYFQLLSSFMTYESKPDS